MVYEEHGWDDTDGKMADMGWGRGHDVSFEIENAVVTNEGY